jgi:UDP-N-acetylmuramate dehydrogenase
MELLLRENVPLSQYTTLKVGGVADYVVEVKSVEDLKKALMLAQERTKTAPLILGGGSNVLIPEEGYRGLVIIMNMKGREYKDEADTLCQLRLGAGEVLDDVVAETCEKGLWGLENLSSIPGSVGATPVQNVGAYGAEVSSLITNVQAIHRETFEEKNFSNDECVFLYRDSFFKSEAGKSWIITSVTFSLSKTLIPQLEYADLVSLRERSDLTPQVVREAVQVIRAGKFPDWHTVGTAGSFFKNPIIEATHFADLQQQYPGIVGYIQENDMVKVSLGWILDKVCGLKGYCDEHVCLFEKQALVLVTKSTATADDIKKFTVDVQKKVFEKTKINIETEVLFV